MIIPKDVMDAINLASAPIFPTGSRYICSPPPVDTDEDWLVLVPAGKLEALTEALELIGFEWDHGEHYDDQGNCAFLSYHRGQLNLILTESDTFADKHRAATEVCKKLNLLRKEDRIMVFQAVLYGTIGGGDHG